VDPRKAIKIAHEAVIGVDLPQEFRQAAFVEILRYELNTAQVPAAQPSTQLGKSNDGPSAGLARLAIRVGVSELALSDVFEIDGDVALHVASSRIDTVKSRATKEVALLIASARQGSGVDDSWTGVNHVRDSLQQYNRYDPNNFSAYLRKAGDSFNFRGKGSSQEIRLTKPGWETAIALIGSFTAEER
jgi:hypothetical protein